MPFVDISVCLLSCYLACCWHPCQRSVQTDPSIWREHAELGVCLPLRLHILDPSLAFRIFPWEPDSKSQKILVSVEPLSMCLYMRAIPLARNQRFSFKRNSSTSNRSNISKTAISKDHFGHLATSLICTTKALSMGTSVDFWATIPYYGHDTT